MIVGQFSDVRPPQSSGPSASSRSSRSWLPSGESWERIAAYLVRRRVRITVAVFVALMLEDILIGVRPHPVLSFRDPESVLGLGLVLLGLVVRSSAAGVLHKSRELTTTGLYSLIRNPLYVGSFLIMSGFATLIDDVENIFVILGPLAGLYFLQVRHEERFLSGKFSSQWHDYAAHVPRFFPRRLSGRAFVESWSLRDWLGSREYRAMAAVLVGIAAVEVWRLM